MKSGSNDLQLLSINTYTNSYRHDKRRPNYIVIRPIKLYEIKTKTHTQEVSEEIPLSSPVGLGKRILPVQVYEERPTSLFFYLKPANI